MVTIDLAVMFAEWNRKMLWWELPCQREHCILEWTTDQDYILCVKINFKFFVTKVWGKLFKRLSRSNGCYKILRYANLMYLIAMTGCLYSSMIQIWYGFLIVRDIPRVGEEFYQTGRAPENWICFSGLLFWNSWSYMSREEFDVFKTSWLEASCDTVIG